MVLVVAGDGPLGDNLFPTRRKHTLCFYDIKTMECIGLLLMFDVCFQ